MRRVRNTKAVLPAALMALALGISCSDDSNPPGPDGGKLDGPPPAGDSFVPTETSPPPTDGSTPSDGSTAPTKITAHMEEACGGDLYSVNVSTASQESTCSDIYNKGIDYLQVLVGDLEKKPPAAGRTYTVKSQSQVNIYPADGEATAVFLSTSGNENVKSGSFTVDPHSAGAKVFTGSFSVTLDSGKQLSGTFLADFCPFDPTSCG